MSSAMLLVNVAVSVIMLSCKGSNSPSYLEFMQHNQDYYHNLAMACDKLLSRTNETQNSVVMHGDDSSLPAAIRELHATKVGLTRIVGEGVGPVTSVWIMVGVSRSGFGITWEQNDYGNGKAPWELSANADGKRTVLFSYEKLPKGP